MLTDSLDLHQLTVDEALLRVNKFLDDAFLSGQQQVAIVHGKGTGILRLAVRRQLKKHPLVRSFRPGGHGEGGDGVTMVALVRQ